MATLPTAADLYSQAMGQIQGWGNSQQAALQQSYQNSLGQGMQSLASSGLAGTSVAPSMRMGYMRQYQQSLNALNDQLTQSKLGAESTFGLGGIQLQQSQQSINNQYALGQGNLAVSQQYAGIAAQQLELQKQQQKFTQGIQSQQMAVEMAPYNNASTFANAYNGYWSNLNAHTFI